MAVNGAGLAGVIATGHESDTSDRSYKKLEVTDVPFEKVLQIIGFGRVQVYNMILGGLILMAVLNETLGMGVVIPAAKCDLKLSTTQAGIFSSVTYLGIVISSHFWGYIADTRGRRKVILYTVLVSNFCTLIASFSLNYEMLIVARFFTGFFLAAGSSTVYAYMGEFNTNKNRATVISWASVSVGISYLYVASTGWLVSYQNWSFTVDADFVFKPWRFLLIIYMLPGFCGAIWLFWLPESPKFLMARGRDGEALRILAWIYKQNNRKSTTGLPVQKVEAEFKEASQTTGIFMSMWAQMAPLLKPPHLVHFVVCCFLQFGVFAVSCGLGLWFPEIIDRVASGNSTTGQTLCQMLAPSLTGNHTKAGCTDDVNSQVFIDTLAIGGMYVFVFVLVSLLMRPVGRGRILAFCLFVSGACGLSLQWVSGSTWIVLLFGVFLVLPGVCIAVVNGGAVGIFPTTQRAMAVSIALLWGRIGTVIASNFVGRLLEYNCDATFLTFAITCFACGLANFLLPSR